MKHHAILAMLTLSLGGCLAGDGSGLDDNGQPITSELPVVAEPDDPNETPTDGNSGNNATLAYLQEEVLTPICAQCHFGTNAPVGLRMDSLEESTNNLLNTQAVLNPQFQRVEPGDAQNSFIYLKIVGDPVAGNRMPLGLPALSDDVIGIFETWIDSGALIDSSTATVAKATVSSSDGILRVSIAFDQPIETQTLVAEQIYVSSLLAGADAYSLTPKNDYHSVWRSNRLLDIEIVSIPEGSERLSINFNDASTSTVTALNGVVLDGDEDGIPGGGYHYEFSL